MNILLPTENTRSLSSGAKDEQLTDACYAVENKAQRGADAAPDYVHLIEAELKAFQMELRFIEAALAAGKR